MKKLQGQTTDKQTNTEFYKENVILDFLKTVIIKFGRNDNLCKKFYGEIIKTLRKTGFNDERVNRLIILLIWNELKRHFIKHSLRTLFQAY